MLRRIFESHNVESRRKLRNAYSLFFIDKVKKIHITPMDIKQTQDLSRKTNRKKQLGRARMKWKLILKVGRDCLYRNELSMAKAEWRKIANLKTT